MLVQVFDKRPNILLVLKEAEFSYNRPRFGVLSLTGILLSRDAVNAFETDLFGILLWDL